MKHWKSPWPQRAFEARGKRASYGGSWSRLSLKLRQNSPLCQRCGINPSEQVHHVVPVRADPRLKLDPRNVLVVCRACHEELDHPR